MKSLLVIISITVFFTGDCRRDIPLQPDGQYSVDKSHPPKEIDLSLADGPPAPDSPEVNEQLTKPPLIMEKKGQSERELRGSGCKPTFACSVLGGTCVRKEEFCSGKIVPGGCSKKRCNCCIPVNQCVAEGGNPSILWKKVDSAETTIKVTVNDGNENVKLALETKIQDLEKPIHTMQDNLKHITEQQGGMEIKIQNLENMINIMHDNIKGLIEYPRCPCPDGFFSVTGSCQCFRIYKETPLDWYDSRDKCHNESLVLAHPSDAVSLRSYLVQTYGPETCVWLNAVGNGQYITWQDNSEPIQNNNPLWEPRAPVSVKPSYCLVLLAITKFWNNEPTKPFWASPCVHTTEHVRYPLCELK